MAQHSYSTGRSRGNRGRGNSRGRRGGYYGESYNYHLRSRDTGQQGYYSNEYSGRYSGSSEYQEGSKGVWKGNPKNKNTNVEYFWRTESPFSQFHPANFGVHKEMFVCAEQYMMWSKARVFSDYRSLTLIMQTEEPKIMKKYGRGVENFDPDIWDMCCRQIVQEGNTAKFSQNCGLLEKLLLTENKYFAEASPGDRKWGIGMGEDNPQSNNPDSWRGSNWLGEALNTVKYEFQLIIFLTMNGEYIKQAPKSNLFDLFKIGTCEYFEKMKCDILISEGKEEIFTDAPSRNRSGKKEKKKYKQTKIESKTNEKAETLAPSFDVPLPKCLSVQKELLGNIELENLTQKIETVESTTDKLTTSLGENISDEKGEKIETEISEGTQSVPNSGDEPKVIQKCETKEKLKDSKQIFPENKEFERESKKDTPIENKQKQSPSAKRKFQSQQEYTQEKIKFKPAKITFDAMPVPKTKVPNSKRISCEYIFTDWARAKICDDLTILNCFMKLSIEDISQLTGNFVYQTNKEFIGIDISVSSMLIELQTEFNCLERIFKGYSHYLKDFDCATNLPYPPSLKSRVGINTGDIWLTRTQPDTTVRKNTRTPEDKSVIFATEKMKKQDEPDQVAKNTDIPQETTNIPIAKNTDIPQETTNIPIAKNTDMPHETTNIPIVKNTDIPQETTNIPIAKNTDIPQETTNIPIAKNTDIPQDTMDIQPAEDNEIAKEKLDDVKITATPDTQIVKNPLNPSAGETGTENIPVKSNTVEVGTDIIQESSIEDNKPEKEQETINAKNTETGNQQETINAENTETANQQETINAKNTETANQQETINAKNTETSTQQETKNADNTETSTQQETKNADNPETGKEEENVNKGNLESEKEVDITLDENTETNINESYNTSASEMEISTELTPEAKSNPPPLDQDINKEEPKPKINKKSPSQSIDETDTAKRPKHDTQTENKQTCKQLVPYDSSSNSDQEAAENKNKQTEKISSKTGTKHTNSEENIETKRAKSEPQPEINLESSSPVENEISEDDPKEKPADSVSDKPSRGKKKKKPTTIFSSGLH